MVDSVPVLYVTGPVGVGKSTVVRRPVACSPDRGVAYAAVDTEWLGDSWPRPAEDPWNGRVLFENLRWVWGNFRRAGAARLICAGVVTDRSVLSYVAEAIPGAELTVVRLRAPISVIEDRLRAREPAGALGWYIRFAHELNQAMESVGLDDHIVDNVDVSVTDVAEDILNRVGWI